MKRFIIVLLALTLIVGCFVGCDDVSGSAIDKQATINIVDNLSANQPTPTDINYSLERYNLIRRAYWVNGQREKANALVCEIEKPLGYIVLFGESGTVISSFVVDGKVSSLNSYLSPDSEFYDKADVTAGTGHYTNNWLADVDGSYGENDNGIFFFTPDGKYIEWTGTYLYSDIPFIVEDPVVKVGAVNE